MKTSNRQARTFVQRLHPFQGNNLYGTYFCTNPSSANPGDSGYAVFSYGEHWPLFIATTPIEGGPVVWFENEERHSVTTSKHRSQSHPHQPTTLLSKQDMQRLLTRGYRHLMKTRLGVPASSHSEQTEFHREVA